MNKFFFLTAFFTFAFLCPETFTGKKALVERMQMLSKNNHFPEKIKKLVTCGEDKVFIIDPYKSDTSHAKIIWQWTMKETKAQLPQSVWKKFITIDDCKPIENNTKLLLTASSGGTMLIDIARKKCLWYALTPMAHSAEMLPGNKLAVALSRTNRGNAMKIFDGNQNNKELLSDSLYCGHGVVWVDKLQRLYALGFYELRCYKFTGLNTSIPHMTLEKSWQLPSNNGHELTYITDNKLLVSVQKNVYIFDIAKQTFSIYKPLNNLQNIKSANLNVQTGQVIYTKSEIRWWTHHLYSLYPTWKTTIENVNLYKVRVFK